MQDNPDCVKWNVGYENWFALEGAYPETPQALVGQQSNLERKVDTIFGRVAIE